MAELKDKLECCLHFRLFWVELKQIENVVKKTVDSFGEKKYENISHYCRAAVMTKLREDIEANKKGEKSGTTHKKKACNNCR